MLDSIVWNPIIMHAAVGFVSLFALFTISQTSYINKLLFGTPNDSSLKINENSRSRKRKGLGSTSSPGTIHGLVNTGNTCFLNSVLQALSSSTYLYQYLNSSPIITEELDLTKLTLDPDEFPVTNALFKTMKVLNMLVDYSKAAYPTEVVHSLQDKMRITTYEQQDAQELFQILSDALNEEENIVVQQGRSNSLLDIDVLRGLVEENNRNSPGRLGGWPMILSQGSAPNGRRDPLHGLLASRLSCVQCGYTAAIRHFAFNNISLSLPFRASCTLEECLLSYITIESLQDVVCRKCSLQTTLKKAEDDERCQNHRRKSFGKTKAKSKPKPLTKNSPSAVRIQKLKQVLKYNIEEELGPDFPVERVVSHHCTKQVMFAKPPQVLCLHLNRSAYFPNGSISKNPCKVKFPEFLDLSPFCTTGHLVLGPQSPLSIPDSGSYPRHIYRLQAVIVHYGSHSYGHFVTYRRKPSTETWSVKKQNGDSIPPHLASSLAFFNSSPTEWFQVSDQSVLAADKLDVLSSNPYMLLYEAVPALSHEPEPLKCNVPAPLASNKDLSEQIVSSPSPSPSTTSPGPPTPGEAFPSEADFIVESPHPALSSSLTSSSQLSGNSNPSSFDRMSEIHLPD